jgi:hypothetical protein
MAAGARPGRKWIVLAVLVALGLLAWWQVDRQLEPHRLTTTVLGQLGKSLELDFAFDGTPVYALRPEPRLRVPRLVVTDPATGRVIARADALDVSLPWSTVRGGDLVITRLDLERPTIDVAGVQRWLAARPEAPFELPTFRKGLRVADGTLVGEGWRVEGLRLALPRLAAGEAVDLEFAGRVRKDAIDASLQGTLHVDRAQASSPFALDADATLARDPQPLRGALAAKGSFALADGRTAVVVDTLRIDGEPPLPELAGRGRFELAQALAFGFTGELASWPGQWPALPMPLAQAQGPFPIALDYRGRPDLSDPLGLGLSMGEARLDARVRVPELLAWIDAPPASPLPPLAGRLTLPRIDFGGTTLRGVTVEMHDDAPVAPPAAAIEAVEP